MAAATSGNSPFFFSAGEASGDAYAAALISRLKARQKDLDFSAVGGARSSEVARLVSNSSTWGAVGILESLKVVPRVWAGYRAAATHLRNSKPGVFVPIDFGYLNVKLARIAKGAGWKVLYFIPPGSWRRTKQGSDLPAITDEIVTPFSWSAEILNEMGAKAHFFGHPLKEMVGEVDPNAKREGLAILPGSRTHEIERNLEPIAQAIQNESGPIRFAVASSFSAEKMAALWKQAGGPPAEFRRDTYNVLRESRAAIICSGTATLEAAICRCPCIVVYRGSKAMEIEFKIRKPKFDYISLPNILLDRKVLPELIQHDANPSRIAQELREILEDSGKDAQLRAFTELDAILGPSECLERTADLLLQLSLSPPRERDDLSDC